MRYYAHFRHTDFVLCLEYGASYVKDFFLNYGETSSNDFVLENGARDVKLFSTDISDWRITFVDTGLKSPIGERLRRVRRFVEDEPMFLANYADVLTDAPLSEMINHFEASNAATGLLAVPIQSSHHVVDIGDDGLITRVTPMQNLLQWENGGYFVLRPEIFDYLNEGEDLVEDAFIRLVSMGCVLAYKYRGCWLPADIVKERVQLEEMYERGNCPWMIWDKERSGTTGPSSSAIIDKVHDAVPASSVPISPAGDPEMLSLRLSISPGRPMSVLALGAHPDDIELGAGGTLLSLAESHPGLRLRYVVLTGTGDRQAEAQNAASSFLPGGEVNVGLYSLPDGRLPAAWSQVKDILEETAESCAPDVIIGPSPNAT